MRYNMSDGMTPILQRAVAFLFLFCASPRIRADDTPTVQRASVSAPTIRVMRAYPFNETTGVIENDDVLSSRDGGRWNDTTTSALFVIVEVVGAPGQRYDDRTVPKYRVVLSAAEPPNSMQLFTATRDVKQLSSAGTLYLPFIVYLKRCMAVQLKAKLLGSSSSASVVENLAAFACGE